MVAKLVRKFYQIYVVTLECWWFEAPSMKVLVLICDIPMIPVFTKSPQIYLYYKLNPIYII